MAAADITPDQDCRERCLRLLDQRAHSTAELRRKLQQRGYSADLIRGALADLTACALLDDLAFAKEFCEYRLQSSRPRGRAKVEAELRHRGVAPAHVAQALASVWDGDDAAAAEAARAEAAAAPKWRQLLSRNDTWTAKQKLCRFLAGRGFSASVCRAVSARLADE